MVRLVVAGDKVEVAMDEERKMVVAVAALEGAMMGHFSDVTET